MNLVSDYPPREYQVQGRDAWLNYVAAGGKRGIIALAGGLGKTKLAHFIMQRSGRTLFLVNLDVLVKQTVDSARELFPDIDVGVVKAESNAVAAKHLVVASLQTLNRKNRLESLMAAGDFELVVVDECHLYLDMYQRILSHEKLQDVPALGLTATAERHDPSGLAKGWGVKPIFKRTYEWGVENGWLSPFVTDRVKTNMDVSHLEIGPDGDYDIDDLEKEEIRAELAKCVASRVAEYVQAGRKFVVFATSVNQSQKITQLLRGLGVEADHVDANTDGNSRKATLSRYKRGETKALVNCGCLCAGFDEPSINAVAVARMTKSRPFYQQMALRGSRIHPGKTDFLILDVVGAHDAHGITAPSLLDDDEEGAEKKQRKRSDELEQFIGAERDGEFTMVVGAIKASADGIEVSHRKKRAKAQWISVTPEVWALSVGDQGVLVLRAEGDADQWRGYRLPRDAWSIDEARPIMRRSASLELATGVAEDRARKLGAFGISSSLAKWRKEPPSEKQLEQLTKLDPTSSPRTRGEASDAIEAARLKKMFAARDRVAGDVQAINGAA